MVGIGKRRQVKYVFAAVVAQLLALVLVAPPKADIGPNSLRVDTTDYAVVLTWNVGTGPYAVYRSTAPAGVAVPANLITQTANTFYFDPLSGLPTNLYFYQVGNPPQCLADPACNDGNVCNGLESCNVAIGTCTAGTPLSCSDGIACTTDSCNPVSGCQYLPNDTLCNDANECSTDSCSTSSGCVHTNVADGTPCGSTLQSCQGGQCISTCFAAGTLVRTANGLRPIEQLRAGDMVATVFGKTGETGLSPLRALEERQASDLVSLVLETGEEIHVTGEHHFWVNGSRWVRARELTASDTLRSFDTKRTAVRGVVSRGLNGEGPGTGEPVPVYNLRLDGAAAYFVGSSGVLTSSCHLTLNLSDLGTSINAASASSPERPWTSAAPSLLVYDSKAPGLTIRPGGARGAAPIALDGAGIGAWAQRVGTKDGTLVILDVEHKSLKLLALDGAREGATDSAACIPGSCGIVRTVPLRTDEIPYGAMIHDDLIFVSYFSGNQVEVYRWVKAANSAPPSVTFVRRYRFDASAELGLSGMAVVRDALLVSAAGWVCRSTDCTTRFGTPHVFSVDLKREQTWPFPDLLPANLNPVGFYTHAPTSTVYLLNSGDSVGGYSSLQRLRRNGTLGSELRLPPNARIGSAFALGPKRFALLQMTGDHVFVIDAEHDRLEGIFHFDGTRFNAAAMNGTAVPDRNEAVLHDALPDPASPGCFYLIDSKGKQLVHARFSEAQGFEALGTTQLPGSDLPSWGVWLPK